MNLLDRLSKPTYCDGCIAFLAHRCDILGEVTLEKKKICHTAGYRNIRKSDSTVRHYANRQGAPNNDDVR